MIWNPLDFAPDFSHCDSSRNNIWAKNIHDIILVLESEIASEIAESNLFRYFKCLFKAAFDFCEKKAKEILIAIVRKFHIKTSELLFDVVVFPILS